MKTIHESSMMDNISINNTRLNEKYRKIEEKMEELENQKECEKKIYDVVFCVKVCALAEGEKCKTSLNPGDDMCDMDLECIEGICTSIDMELDETADDDYYDEYEDEESAEEIYSHCRGYCNYVGLDCEWVGKNKTALMQISVCTQVGIKCFLIRLSKVDIRVCYELMSFLRDEDVVKLGCGIDGDFKRLQEVDFVIFHPSTISFFDLRQIIPATKYQNGGLANLTRQILGRKLNKDYRVRCSNWEAEVLSEQQKTYAADDAVCALQILGKLMQELGESRVQYFVNEYKNTVFKAKAKPAKSNKEEAGKIGQNALEEKVKRRLETRDYGSDYFNPQSASVRKEPLYNNCVKLLAPDGEVLSITDKKKADWYVKKGLGELVEDTETSFIVKLKFEPSGRPNTDSEKYYVTEKENVCVVCNEKDGLLRKNVVPREYRKHFPIVMKCHVSHDVVLLCLRCHGRSNELDYLKRARIATKFDAPLGNADLAKAILEPKDRRNVRSGGNALIKSRNKLPEKRVKELESIIMKFFGAEEWNSELEQKASDLPVLAGNESDAQNFVQHGEKVVTSLMESGGIEEVKNFEVEWRQHFLDVMDPQFMPEGWNIYHNHERIEEKLDRERKRADGTYIKPDPPTERNEDGIYIE
ncbi:Oidioi.mRNA.OKI2018_I69.PAR.g11433.t1.cds [Oikopleura dioica]|uniref:Oidioi.mRNA.OKI2018_I69.PAR.g11433.t1.cds n=1 Tax=Oikopleura dioica TaxID=34765 RepID=A0ABN7S0B4_OIKDI|nr:Oidioi.mRNA.OKI2018_I69.PAR.g11433.t1.cds [Oikopleura dioica]